MNMSLISIAIYCKGMKKEAIETARRMGSVWVDHGETNCKTPDAVGYIKKASARNSKK